VLARQRQAYILDRIRTDGGVRVADLVGELAVSDMTVRRDLELLDQQGLIEKVHGGATIVQERALFEPGFRAKSSLEQEAKEAIAEAAADLVLPGSAVAISAGTTTYAVARRLLDRPGLTIVTNSLPVADLLHRRGRLDQRVILTGGVRTPSDALVGPFAVASLRAVHVDRAILGVHGMDAKAGFTSPNLFEAETDRALVETARSLVVVADHTKWGVVGMSTIVRIEQADVLITDSRLGLDAQSELGRRVGKLVVVEPGHGAPARAPEVTRIADRDVADARDGAQSVGYARPGALDDDRRPGVRIAAELSDRA
jgi:DeoR/GlpR family transcriptional regulator of sugar metabolism